MSEQRDELTHVEQTVYSLVRLAAMDGLRCPTNAQLAKMVNRSTRAMQSLMWRLEQKGWIAVETRGCARIVTLTACGTMTRAPNPPKLSTPRKPKPLEPPPPEPPPPVYIPIPKAPPQPRPDRNAALFGRKQAASRDPCVRCGVPGFKGCAHQAPYPGADAGALPDPTTGARLRFRR